MVVGLAVVTRRYFSTTGEEQLRVRVQRDVPDEHASSVPMRERLGDPRYYREGARYSLGDVTMLRKELVAGFVIAGFLSVHVSNIPLAAALWIHGVAFGGVISFVFADLVTLPLLFIYRRFYGSSAAIRLLLLLWPLMSLAGLLVDLAFRATRLLPTTRHSAALGGHFPLGSTLVLNCLAVLVVIVVWILAHHRDTDLGATDPICGMHVDTSAPAATRELDGVTQYFCSQRCAQKFDDAKGTVPTEDDSFDAVDPVCEMHVHDKDAPSALGPDGVTYYFCSPGCRETFLQDSSTLPGSSTIERGPTP